MFIILNLFSFRNGTKPSVCAMQATPSFDVQFTAVDSANPSISVCIQTRRLLRVLFCLLALPFKKTCARPNAMRVTRFCFKWNIVAEV